MALMDPRKERFAQAVMQGKSYKEAWLEANPHTKLNNQTILRKARAWGDDSEINQRLNELRAAECTALVQKFDVTAERVLEELVKVGFADIGDCVEVNKKGKIGMKKDAPTRAIKSINQNKQGSIIVQMHDKIGALEKLAQITGLYEPKVKVDADVKADSTIKVVFEGETDEWAN